MQNILDNIHLSPPAICTVKCNVLAVTVDRMKSDCAELKALLDDDKLIKIEMALVSKLVYRNTLKLRLDKGFQNFRNLKRLFKKYRQCHIGSAIKHLTACFPEDSFGSAFYMPSRQLLQFLLYQLIIVVALLEKIVYFSEKAGYFFLARLKAGHSWSMALIFLAVCARVSYILRRLSWKLCMQYNVLAEYLPKLKLSGPNWPRDEFCFPPKLETELGVANPSFVKKSLEIDLEDRPEIFKLLDNLGNEDDLDDVQFCEQKFNPITISDEAEVITVADVKLEIDVKNEPQEDCGEVVEIKSITKGKKNKKKRRLEKMLSSSELPICLTVDDNEDSVAFTSIKKEEVSIKKVKREQQAKVEGSSVEEMIDNVNSLQTLNLFMSQVVSDPSNTKHSSVRRQLGGIVQTLKKKKGNDIEMRKLLARAKDVLRSNLM